MYNHIINNVLEEKNEEDSIENLFREQKMLFYTFKDWNRIDQFENDLGKSQNRVKVKVKSREDIIELLKK